ncbi:MAG TPA: hypothetical protein VFW65_33555 [Pseudonocardiaceae bacterium]|nr:hypothetical protein [Pseudonocardiaceae bacterium]
MTPTATAFSDIDVGRRFPARSWLVDDAGLDAGLDEYEQWHEWFAFADGAGRRLVPPVMLASPSVAANPYDFLGIAAGTESHSTGLVYAGEPYSITVSADEKYVKRGLRYVWFKAEWTDSAGTLVHVYRWLQVVSLLARSTDADRPAPRDITGLAAEDLDQHPYVPPLVSPRAEADWARPPEPFDGYLPATATVGYPLAPEATRFSWRRARDYAEYAARRTGLSRAYAAYNHHSHDDAARERGLPGGVVSAINLDSVLATMLQRALGTDWLRSGRLRCRYLRTVAFTDFFVAKARLVAIDGPALTFDVWAENQRGETVLGGTADVLRTAGTP